MDNYVTFIVGGLLCLYFVGIFLFTSLPPVVTAAIIIALLIPSLAAMVHNYRTQKKSLKLEEEFRPEITIVYLSEEEARRDQG